jgi:PTH1 family peptidyl-tRNA hydrolase
VILDTIERMKLIVGLGNPGEKYKNNRHNVGFMFVDYLLKMQNEKCKNQNDNLKFKMNKFLFSEIIEFHDLILAKPQTFMNESGIAANKIIANYGLRIADLFVVHDDLDIPLGTFHIQKGVGPKLHNGISSIEQHLKTKDFWRIRIGVDNRDSEKRIDGETYVLQDFLLTEKAVLQNTIFPKIISEFSFVFSNKF